MSRSQSSHELHAQLMLAAQRSDNFFPIESPGSSTPSSASSTKLSSLRRKLVKRRPSNDSGFLVSFHPIPQTAVAEVRSRKQSNQPLPLEALDTVIKNVDAILSPTYPLEQKAPPAVTRSLPDPRPVAVHKRPSRPSTSPELNNVNRSVGFVRDDASIPHRAIQRTPNPRQLTEDNILPPDPFARSLPSRSKSYSDMRDASQESRPPMPKMPLTPPGSEISSEVSPTEVTPGHRVRQGRMRSSTVVAYYTPPSSTPVSQPTQQSREKGLAECPQTPDSVLDGKSSSTRSPGHAFNGRNPHAEAPGMRSAPQPHTDYGFVDGMWKESRSPTESSDDFSSPRTARSASEPEVHPPPHRPRPPRSKRPTTANGSASTPSSSDAHQRTQSELSNFPYTSFLDPTGAPPHVNKIPPSLRAHGPPRPAAPQQNGPAAAPPISPSNHHHHDHLPRLRTPTDRLTPEEIERRAISKYRALERGVLGADATTTLSGPSPQDARHVPRSENPKPSAQSSAMTAVMI